MSDTLAPMETAITDAGNTTTTEAKGAPILHMQGVERHYRQGETLLEILRGAELALWPGQSIALVGPSGAGKSTLLHIAGLLEHPDAGEVYVDQAATSRLSDAERTRIRRTEIGFVYQAHRLLPEFSALENVVLPQMIRGLAAQGGIRPRGGALDLSWAEGSPDAPPVRAVRRRATTGRDRSRGRQRAAHSVGRRADR